MLLSNIRLQNSIFMNVLRNTTTVALPSTLKKIGTVVVIVLASLTAILAIFWKILHAHPKAPTSNPQTKFNNLERTSTDLSKIERTSKIILGKNKTTLLPPIKKEDEMTISTRIKDDKKSSIEKPLNDPSVTLNLTDSKDSSLNSGFPSPLPIDPLPIWPEVEEINAHPELRLTMFFRGIDYDQIDALFVKNFLQENGNKLTCLNLDGLAFNDDELSELIKLVPNIEHLSIDSHKITDNGLACLKGLPLKSIELGINHTEKTVAQLKGLKLTSVKFRSYWGRKDLTDDALVHLEGIPLTSVEFGFCHKLTEKGIAHLKNIQLTSIKFNDCGELTDEALAHLKKMPLRSVRFVRCSKLTDKGLFYLKDMKLTSVIFGDCNNLSDDGIAYLKGMPIAKAILFCKKITDKICDILDGMPLTRLSLKGCNQISDNAASAFILKHNLVRDAKIKNLWKK